MGPKGVTPSNGWSCVSVLLRADMFSNLSPETVRLGSSRAMGGGEGWKGKNEGRGGTL